MSWNGSGIFIRGFSWVNDAANSIPITASRMDADTNDIVNNGFGNTLTRDGQGAASANLPMNGFKHTNCALGVAATDYATMGQISGFAPINSPSFTGVPIAPTPSGGDNSTRIATTAFTVAALGSYLPLTGGTITGSFVVNQNVNIIGTAQINSLLTLTSNLSFTTGGSTIQFAGNQLVFDNGGNSLGFRSGSPSNKFATLDASGNFNALSGNVTTTGVFVAGGVNQPTIFIQSATPTARNVGDLWFF